MTEKDVQVPVVLLTGLRQIGAAMGAGPRTIQGWIRKYGLPAKKGPDGKYRISPAKLQAWWDEYESPKGRS